LRATSNHRLRFQFYGPLHKALRAETDEELKAISAQIKDGLNIFESELESRKSKFLFSSERPGLLDYTIWPWFERLPSFEKRVGSVLGGLPRLVRPKIFLKKHTFFLTCM
jgi:glutathione S-transferase